MSKIIHISSTLLCFQHLQATTLIEDVTPDLRMRDRELTEIAKSIADLAELFKDLSVLVIDQGTLLDSVEYNIEQTTAQVAEAVKELDMATRYVWSVGCFGSQLRSMMTLYCTCIDTPLCPRVSSYQKNTGRRKCIFLLLLIIFGLIVVLIFKPRRHTSAPPSAPPSVPPTRSLFLRSKPIPPSAEGSYEPVYIHKRTF
jgi:syntaxin 16